MIWIEAFNSVTVRGAKMFETAMLERMVNVKALIVRPVVPAPVVLVDVWQSIHMTGYAVLRFGPGVGIVPFLRRRRKVALIGARPILPVLLIMLLTALRANGKSRD
jgi:hypothetical protein